MAGASFYPGSWEIVRSDLHGSSLGKTGIEGTKFHFEDTGDVRWDVPEGVEQLPLFNCDTYEVFSVSIHGIVIRFGTFAGHVFEFRVMDQVAVPDSQSFLNLICEDWCTLYCQRLTVSQPKAPTDFPFSLLSALNEGFFSDVTIEAENHKTFQAHSCILMIGSPELEWQSWLEKREQATNASDATAPAPPLSGLPEDVLATVLHYIYSLSLPLDLSEETALRCIESVGTLPGFHPLASKCQAYLNNMTLRNKIMALIGEMHSSLETVINYFSSKASPGNYGAAENLGSNPARLCNTLKQSTREFFVVLIKLVMFCELFNKEKADLSTDDQHEIISFAKSYLPIFLSQLSQILQGLKAVFNAMSASQRNELAMYLVLEIDNHFEVILTVAEEIKSAIEQIIITLMSPTENNQKNNLEGVESIGGVLQRTLKNRELSRIRSVHQELNCSLIHFDQKKERFLSMTTANKVRSVSRNVEQLTEELPIFLLRLEEVMAALEEKFEWRDFKFCFRDGASKVSGVLHKLLTHRAAVYKTMEHLSELVQRDSFTNSLISLGLLDPPAQSLDSTSQAFFNTAFGSYNATQTQPEFHVLQLNLVKSFRVPQLAMDSKLSESVLELLKSERDTDMLFEVVNSAPDLRETADVSEPTEQTAPEVHVFKAHRVIVAARCDWFRRALLSGMRESIDRKIVVHDTSHSLFKIFLEYLYCGRLDAANLSLDQLTDLMLLADRYELDSLKQASEQALQGYVDEETALCLLSMSEQINARLLRDSCIFFISSHPDVMETELFEELPHCLQAEVYKARSSWAKPKRPKKQNSSDRLLGLRSRSSSPTSAGSSIADLDDFAYQIQLDPEESARQISEGLLPNGSRLNNCLEQLQDIVGPVIPRERLIQVVLAADFNVNRALNFIFSLPNESSLL
ncbi:uncharacterized protein LOC132199661 [Neocloeon triangulifer]|uniref:uncharacterized protein LOC132199661 n=1 Tax=Neocloeon triangulifer TaxID=2078957 RepID=UPI00286EEF2D|nr:uncharacterized protein LOC132199661 [Neocloeon triangulifer]